MVLMLLSSLTTVQAAGEGEERINSVEHRFRLVYWQDGIDIDETYLDNQNQIDHIRRYLAQSPRIDSITVYAWASPEGVYERNVWLSEKRAQAAKRFLLENAPEGSALKAENIILRPMHENWDGFLKAVEETYFREDREKVLAILRNDKIKNDTKKWRLKQLDRGNTYRYLIRHQMPQLRVASWICIWAPTLPPLPEPNEPKDSLTVRQQRLEFRYQQAPQPEKERKTIMAARSNLLVPGLNVGLEFPIKDNWSVGVDYYYPWFVSNKNHWCGEMLGWFVDMKHWFSSDKYEWSDDDRLKGHALGVYIGAGYYDYQSINQGYQGEYIDTGVDYTFALPVGPRDNRWMRLEFNIGLGWIRTYARRYEPSDDFSQLIKDPGVKNMVFDYFGPTRASVSFVMPITITRNKGGER